MRDRGLTQAELARRVGVKQPTIFKLIHDNKTGSAHLHKVARELGTTPAYLAGETDDPDSTLPDEPDLSAEERAVVDCLRQIAPKDRAALIQLARTLATIGNPEPPPTVKKYVASTETLHAPRVSYRGQ
ncbi:MAG TPA: helix-turn-helix domain-containing protein [Novosphingobium sp.]|nr:helix-turn-helix domain-containing protein [Novosphingobium sp. 17-62-19]HQS95064.1 helix-turn-helix domain-containing protein [Novosphingobium sp.]